MSEKEIVIKLRPIHVERGILAVLILGLIYFGFVADSEACPVCQEQVIGNVVDTQVEVAAPVEEETAKEAETELVVPEEQFEEAVEETPKKIVKSQAIDPDKIKVSLNDVVIEDKKTYKKITGVSISLDNEGPQYKPYIEIMVYEPSTQRYEEEIVRGTARYDLGIPSGSEQEFDIDFTRTASYSDMDTKKTVVIALYDGSKSTPEFIKKTTTQISI